MVSFGSLMCFNIDPLVNPNHFKHLAKEGKYEVSLCLSRCRMHMWAVAVTTDNKDDVHYQAFDGGVAAVTLMFTLPLPEATCSFSAAISLSLSISTFLRYSTSSSADILLFSRKLFWMLRALLA